MYLRITRGHLDPTQADAFVPLSDEIAAALRRQPGFQNYWGGVDRTIGMVIAVSAWDTEAHARFSRDVLGDVVGRVQALGTRLEPAEIYEIVS